MPQKEEKKVIQIEYNTVRKNENPLKEILKSIPKEFRPTEKTLYIFLAIFIIVIAWGIIVAMMPITTLQFDFNNKDAEPFELEIHVGWPMQFFGTPQDENASKTDIKMSISGAVVDFLLYLILSYLIDILINFLLTVKLGPSEEELRRRPKIFQFRERSTGEKVAEKVVNTVTKKTEQKKEENKKQQNTPQQKVAETKKQQNAPQQKVAETKPKPSKKEKPKKFSTADYLS